MMTHASTRHRSFDRAAAEATGDAPGHAVVPSRDRGGDARTLHKPRALLLEVEIRTSERTGRPWYSAWLGKARLIGFEADEPNERGHRVIRFYAEVSTMSVMVRLIGGVALVGHVALLVLAVLQATDIVPCGVYSRARS